MRPILWVPVWSQYEALCSVPESARTRCPFKVLDKSYLALEWFQMKESWQDRGWVETMAIISML